MELFENDVTTDSVEVSRDERSNFLSSEGLQIFKIVNCVILSSIIGIFGICANVINIVIFYKRGLNNTVNISLFGIAISDLASLITAEWLNICLNPLVENSDIPMVTAEIQYLTAGWPHVCFTRITCCITVYVTAERCLCISVPLKVKRIFTPWRTKIAICSIYLLMFLCLVPEYATAYFDWAYYQPRNRTLLRLLFTHNRESVLGLVFVLNSTLGLLSFLAVTLCTAILVWKLKVMARWRQNSTFNLDQFCSFSLRDRKTVNMIVLIATILIICYTPGTVFLMITFFVPEFSVVGRYSNVFLAAWTFGLLLEVINSSVNIFLYYKMSTRYRQTFGQILACCRSQKSRSTSCHDGVKSYVNISQTGGTERSDSDVVYEISTDMGELNLPRIGTSQELPFCAEQTH